MRHSKELHKSVASWYNFTILRYIRIHNTKIIYEDVNIFISVVAEHFNMETEDCGKTEENCRQGVLLLT